jgi:hypothetical protein
VNKLSLLALPALALIACKPGTPARSVVTEGSRDQVLTAIEPAMRAAGHVCTQKETGLLCDANVKGKLMFVLVVLDTPIRRVSIVVFSKMKGTCEDALPRFNEVNRHVDMVTVSCTKEGAFGAVGSLPIPQNGLTGEDVSKFTDTWMFTFLTAVNSYQLLDVIE